MDEFNIRKFQKRRKSWKTQGISDINVVLYARLLKLQGGKCAICKYDPGTDRALTVDHHHKTGAIRGLLCFRCNNGIGWLDWFLKQEGGIENAVAYLQNNWHTENLEPNTEIEEILNEKRPIVAARRIRVQNRVGELQNGNPPMPINDCLKQVAKEENLSYRTICRYVGISS